jgi:hypothetical protein
MMNSQTFVAMLALGFLAPAYGAQEHHVLFDIYYKERGDVIEHAVVRLPVGAAARVVLGSGVDVDVGTSAADAEGKSHLLVQLGGARRIPSITQYYVPSPTQSSVTIDLPEKRDVTVFVRSAEHWPSGL